MKQRTWYYVVGFLFATVLLGFWVGLDDVFMKSPQSAHLWRQTDCAGLARNYYYDGLDFWQPRMMNTFGKDGRSVGEFPITYYLAGCLYALFGQPHEGLMRMLHCLFFVSGCLGFSLIIRGVSGHWLPGMGFGLLLVSSPLLLFYSFNFLVDAPAFGVLLWGWYALWRFTDGRRFGWLLFAMLAICLAGLLKVTLLVTWVALVILYLVERLGLVQLLGNHKMFDNSLKTIAAFFIPPVFSAIWYSWAGYYNAIHSPYLLMELMPIWKVDADFRDKIWHRITHDWHWSYMHPMFSLPTLTAALWVMLTPRKHAPFLYGTVVLCVFGAISLAILWFEQLYHHDYYAIAWMILPCSVWITASAWLTKKWPKIWQKWWIYLVFIAAVAFSANHVRNVIAFRYNPTEGFMKGFPQVMYDKTRLQNFLRKNGLVRQQRVISVPDGSPNASLYLYDLTGLTYYSFAENRKYLPADSIVNWAARGYNYLLVFDRPAVLKDTLMQKTMRHPIDSLDDAIFLYDLRPLKNE